MIAVISALVIAFYQSASTKVIGANAIKQKRFIKFKARLQFDTGAAWENLALEATSRGLAVHGMQGFDYDKAREDLMVPDNFDVVAMIAIGKRGPRNQLPPQLQEREYPNDRKPLKEPVMVGRFSI
jgi:nitroreductase